MHGWSTAAARCSGPPTAATGGWRPAQLARLTWLNATTGLAFVQHAASVQRTTDGGATWQAVAAGLEGPIDAVETSGEQVSVCDALGLTRSADQGRTWRRGGRPFTPKRGESKLGARCSSLAFIGQDGWAVAWEGRMSRTRDGGAHWESLRPWTTGVGAHETQLVRASRTTGWLASDAYHRFRTDDGGASWVKVARELASPGFVTGEVGGRTRLVETTGHPNRPNAG